MTACPASGLEIFNTAMSNSGDAAATRAGAVAPPMRRMVTELLLPTTCTFVISVSADTKNPLPRPLDVSTRTTAGMMRLTTSSSDGGFGARRQRRRNGTRRRSERVPEPA